MTPININDKTLYLHNHDEELNKRTKSRLKEITSLGLTEVGLAQFGIEGKMSGLYIEMVWNYSEKDWAEYIDYIKSLLK